MKNKTSARYIKYDIEVTMNNMKDLRVKAGLTQQNIAELIGKNRSSVSKYENGQERPEFNTLVRLYRVLHGIVIESGEAING